MAKLNWTPEEQGEYFEKNVKLVHSAIQQFRGMVNSTIDYSDLFQMASVGFIKGLETYDTSNGSVLSTYLVTCMKNQVLYETRSGRAKSRTAVVLSYEGTLLGKDGKEMSGAENRDVQEFDTMRNPVQTMEEKVEQQEQVQVVKKIMDKYLTETEKQLIFMHAKGNTQNEIAKALNLSQANVSKKIKQTRCRILLHLRRSGYSY